MFNRDDDLIFTAAADNIVCVWDSETGERLGTYEGHAGAVFDIDVDYKTKFLISGSGDSTIRLWEVTTGQELKRFRTPAEVRVTSVQWACGDRRFLAASPQFKETPACVHIYNNPVSADNEELDEKSAPLKTILVKNDHNVMNFGITKAVWSPLNDRAFALCTDNSIRILDVEKGKQVKKVEFVDGLRNKMKLDEEVGTEMTDFQYCNDYCSAVLTSRSKFAKMYDVNRWDHPICTYQCDRALNAVAMHPKLDLLALGGGKTAQQAALDKRNGKYDCLVYHTIFEQQISRIVTDCFSPLNSMCWNAAGNQLCLGYEQGEAYVFTMDVDFERQFHKREKLFTSTQKDDSDSENEEDF